MVSREASLTIDLCQISMLLFKEQKHHVTKNEKQNNEKAFFQLSSHYSYYSIMYVDSYNYWLVSLLFF